MNKKTFLVTGGTGFIGSNICKLLLKKNYNVKIFDNNYRGSIKKILKIKKKIKFISGDIRDKKKLDRALKNTNAVIHLAYINGTKHFYSNPTLVLDVAVKGISNVIDGCLKNKIKELYLASSSEVYQTPNKIPTNEFEPLKVPDIFNPRYSYGGGKILTELMGIHYGKKYFKKLIIYIEDFINAFNLILNKGKHLNIYNIGTSEKIKIKYLAYKLSKILKKKIVLKTSALRKGGTKIRIPDISKITKLGFKSRFNLDRGLRKILFA